MARKTEKTENLRSLEATGFYSDYQKDGTLYGVLVRSPAATGKIKSITIPELPEGYFFYTQKDIPGKKTISINKTEAKIFGSDYVQYKGEPLGILCGPDEKTLFSILEDVSINFDIESLELELNKVIKHQKRPLIHVSDANLQEDSEEVPDITDFVSEINALPSLDSIKTSKESSSNPETFENSIAGSREIKTGIFQNLTLEEAEAALSADKELQLCSETWTQQLVPPLWKETAGAFCYTEGKKIHIYAPSKWTYCLMTTVSKVLDIPIENIYLHKTRTSGIFSKGLWRTSILTAQIALAAYLCKKPVKLILTQTEQDSYMSPGVGVNVTYKTYLKPTGHIQALYADINIDVGRCNPFSQEIADRMCIAACNFYKPENVYIRAIAHTSKNPPTSICFKSVDSQVFFAIENQIQKIGEQFKFFPSEIRNENAKNNTKFPFSIPQESAFLTFDNSIKISDFNRKYASFHLNAQKQQKRENNNPFYSLPLRGIGIATAYNGTGYNGQSNFSYDSKIEVTLLSGDKAVIHAIKPSIDIQEIWKETAAQALDLKKENIIIDSKYDINDIPENPEDASSTISAVNELIKKCCNEIQKKRFHQPLPISSKKSISSGSKKLWNKETFSGVPFLNTSFATAVVEVELDSYTYNEHIKGIWITVDCGQILDKNSSKRAVRLEVQKELAMLVEEKNVICEKLVIEFIDSKNKSGQLGELIHNTLPAAFNAAISQALSTQFTKLPVTEKQLYQHIKEKEYQNSIIKKETEVSEGENN